MRHFAYFRQADGSYLREQLVDVAGPPSWWARVPAALRDWLFTRWSHLLARPAAGEVAIDVTQFDYPLGDFCWSVLRFGDGDNGKPLLDFPNERTFMQLDRRTAEVVGWWQSSRPCRSDAERLIIDVTGTPWESVYGAFGQFAHLGPIYFFLPDRQRTPAQLAAAAESLSPYDLTPERVMAGRW